MIFIVYVVGLIDILLVMSPERFDGPLVLQVTVGVSEAPDL